MGRYTVFKFTKSQHYEDAIILKLVYKLNAISIKMWQVFHEMRQADPKSKWKAKD